MVSPRDRDALPSAGGFSTLHSVEGGHDEQAEAVAHARSQRRASSKYTVRSSRRPSIAEGEEQDATGALEPPLTARALHDLHRKLLERVVLRSRTQNVKDAFRAYDRERAGVLSLAQFRVLLRDHDFLGGDADALVQHLAGRGAQNVSFHAFLGDIKLGSEQNYTRNAVKKSTKSLAPARSQPAVETVDPLEAIRTKLRQRVVGHNKSIREVFLEQDEDQSGFLDHEEFGRFMAKHKFSPEETRLVVDFLDRDGSGTIDYDEFAAGLLFYRPPAQPVAAVVPTTTTASPTKLRPVKSHTKTPAARGSVRTSRSHVQSSTTPESEPIEVEQVLSVMRDKATAALERKKLRGKRELRAMCVDYDVDGKMALDHQEFGAVLVGLGIKLKPRELQAVLKEIDPNNSELIAFEVLADLLGVEDEVEGEEMEQCGADPDEEDNNKDVRREDGDKLFSALVGLDADGSGEISYDAFRRFMRESEGKSDGEIDSLVEQLDANGNGTISLEQLRRVHTQRRQSSPNSNPPRRSTSVHNSIEKSGQEGLNHVETLQRVARHVEGRGDEDPKVRLAALQEQELRFMEKVLLQHSSVEAAFREFDPEQNDELDFEQFRDFMGQYGMTDEASLSMLIKRLDVDNSGTVDLQEFQSVFNPERLGPHKRVGAGVARRETGPVMRAHTDRRQSAIHRVDRSGNTPGEGTESGGDRVTGEEVSQKLAKSQRVARLRNLEEKWISSALSAHNSVKASFAVVDRDQDGEISRNEFAELMSMFGISEQEDISLLLRQLDVDDAGTVEFEEFATIFHEARVLREVPAGQQVGENSAGSRIVGSKAAVTGESKKARAARLRDLQIKWMKRVLSCHESIEAAFHVYDDDGSGELSHDEFRYFMKRYGIVNNDDIDALIRRLDANGLEAISFEDFSVIFNPARLNQTNNAGGLSALVAGVTDDFFDADELESVLEIERELAARMAGQTRDLRLAFRKFDLNGNGQLEYKEFRAVLKSYRLPEMEIRKVIRHLDRDVSGFIDYKEFIAGFAGAKDSGGGAAAGSLPQKRNPARGSRIPPNRSHAVKPRSTIRRPSVKDRGKVNPSALETLKKTMLETILATHGTVQTVFRQYDLDKVGSLNEAQFVKLALDCGFSRDEAAQLLELFDRDRSGTVEYQEFMAQLVVRGKS